MVTVFATDPGGLAANAARPGHGRGTQPGARARRDDPGPDPRAGPLGVPSARHSHFRDPDGDSLSISAETSNAAAASMTVSGDVVTIARAGTGTATVSVVARDPGGLSARQSIAVDTVGAGAARVPAPTEPRPPAIAASRQAAQVR